MFAIATLVAVCQWIEPVPSHTEVGQEIRIEARDSAGAPIPDLEIRIRFPDGRLEPIGTTDERGERRFVPTVAGRHAVSATHHGVTLLAPLYAEEPFRRIWYAVICVPLGLALLWRNLRRRG